MTSTDVATPETSAELETISPEEQALIDNVKSRFEQKDLVLPLVKLTAALSREVEDGQAKAGEFVNNLTGVNYGAGFELVIVEYFRGRFYSGDEGTFVAYNTDVAPDHWPERYAGQHFADIPDAEETYAAQANSGQREWGSGPPIRTTFNYVGFIPSELEEGSPLPVRISLQRTSRDAARKLNTLLNTSRAPWDYHYNVVAAERRNEAKNARYHVFDVRRGDKATADERQAAIQLATQIRDAASLDLKGDEPEAAPKREKPASTGGIEV